MSATTVDLPEPYPDESEFPYWVIEPGDRVRVTAPGVVALEPEVARGIAADELEAQSFPCVVDDCPDRFVTRAALNRHSRTSHVQTTCRYPGVDAAGDFMWFALRDSQ